MSPAAKDAQAERRRLIAESAGEPMRTDADYRSACTLDLRGAGGPLLTLQPVRGKVAWRAIDENGRIVERCAIKSLLHSVADSMTRMQSHKSASR